MTMNEYARDLSDGAFALLRLVLANEPHSPLVGQLRAISWAANDKMDGLPGPDAHLAEVRSAA